MKLTLRHIGGVAGIAGGGVRGLLWVHRLRQQQLCSIPRCDTKRRRLRRLHCPQLLGLHRRVGRSRHLRYGPEWVSVWRGLLLQLGPVLGFASWYILEALGHSPGQVPPWHCRLCSWGDVLPKRMRVLYYRWLQDDFVGLGEYGVRSPVPCRARLVYPGLELHSRLSIVEKSVS